MILLPQLPKQLGLQASSTTPSWQGSFESQGSGAFSLMYRLHLLQIPLKLFQLSLTCFTSTKCVLFCILKGWKLGAILMAGDIWQSLEILFVAATGSMLLASHVEVGDANIQPSITKVTWPTW